jgi:RNA-directed DNA polymerase
VRASSRLAGLARKAGAEYTRYADDLLFSGDGDFERSLERFRVFVLAILLDEGFSIRHRKTRVMRSGTRQSAAGVLINKRTNIAREDYDRLKAILHNCEKLGPDSQNRDHHPHFRAHLSGRIAYVRMVNHERGEKLQRLFDRIAWGD